MPLRSDHAGAERRARVRKRALVVDGDMLSRIEIRLLLEMHGYLVDEVEDGLEAIGWMDLEGPSLDLVVLDYDMPCLTGPETAQSLRAMRPGLKVMLCVSGEAFARMEPLQDGVVLLAKPFTLDGLQVALAQIQGREVPSRRGTRSRRTGSSGHPLHYPPR